MQNLARKMNFLVPIALIAIVGCAPAKTSQPPLAPVHAPPRPDSHHIIDMGLTCILTAPTAECYNPLHNKVLLLDYLESAWPDDYTPSLPGYEIIKTKRNLPHPKNLDTCMLVRLKHVNYDPAVNQCSAGFDVMISLAPAQLEHLITSEHVTLIFEKNKYGNWAITGELP